MITYQRFRAALEAHEEWQSSGGHRGVRADCCGADLSSFCLEEMGGYDFKGAFYDEGTIWPEGYQHEEA